MLLRPFQTGTLQQQGTGCTTDTTNTVNNIVNKDPELVLGLGDNSYDDSADCWFDIIQPIDSKMKIVIGNHDDETTTLLTST
jgi:predicted phosphodiesterase